MRQLVLTVKMQSRRNCCHIQVNSESGKAGDCLSVKSQFALWSLPRVGIAGDVFNEDMLTFGVSVVTRAGLECTTHHLLYFYNCMYTFTIECSIEDRGKL